MGELSVATPNNNNGPSVHSGIWNPSPLRSANNGDMNSSIGGGKARKRDFRFQIIQVRQGPKWFIWPSHNGNNASTPDANENIVCSSPTPGHPQQNSSDQENHVVSSNDSGNFSSSGNGPSMRRSNRFITSRRKISVNHNDAASAPLAVEGDMVRVTATNHGPTAAPMSEPTTRRLTCRMAKPTPITPVSAATSGFSSPSPASSSSAVSSDLSPSGFQILSVSRKCESDDEGEDFLECSCRAMSLSMDDEAINAVASSSNNDGHNQSPSGIRCTPSITITEPPPSPIVKNACST